MNNRTYVKKWQLIVPSGDIFEKYIEGNKELYGKIEWEKSTVKLSDDELKIIVDCNFKS